MADKKSPRPWAWAGILLACAVLAGCVPQPPDPAPTGRTPPPEIESYTGKARHTGDFFGTMSSLQLYGDFEDAAVAVDFENAWGQVKALLQEIEEAVAVDDPDSDIARFNAAEYGESVPIGSRTAQILRVAREAWRDTGGLYDPTVYPLVDLWGFTPRFNSNAYEPLCAYDRPRADGKIALPDEAYIEAFRALVDFGGVVLSGGGEEGYTLTKQVPPVTVGGTVYQAQMDLGGIAKGYAVDEVVAFLRAQGWEYGYFSCGSSSIGLLQSASEKARADGGYQFSIGVRKPRETESGGTAYLSVAAKDTSLSSSGDYEHSYTRDGVLYCHIIDPATGWPVNTPASAGEQGGLATVTLLGGDAAYSDALTTALCIMGPERALEYLNTELRDYGAVLVVYGAGVETYELLTNLPEGSYRIQDEAYVLSSRVDGEGTLLYTGTLLL